MSGNGDNALGAIMSRLREKAQKTAPIRQIKEAFALTDKPAEMLLLGLQTAGVKNIPAWVREHSQVPARGASRKAMMRAAIAKVQRQGQMPFKEFCNKVRDACPGGWKAKGVPGKGFNNKTIQRTVISLDI
jgi:hypothetical protein